MEIVMRHVSADDAAQIIGVSSATIRNWARAGHIAPLTTNPLIFSEKNIFDLKNEIGSESFDKLKTRANKVGSTNQFIPEEYADIPSVLQPLTNIVDYLKEKRLEPELVMFLATIRLLEGRGEVCISKKTSFFKEESYFAWVRSAVKSVVLEWFKSLPSVDDEARYEKLFEFALPFGNDDFLGLLYQAISKEGKKSEQGSYYTPSNIVHDSLSNIKTPVNTFLDPCCGTGKYLMLAAKAFNLDPENIFGFDMDRVGTNIAKVNLLLGFKDKDFYPKVYCCDSLSTLATGEIFCDTNFLLNKMDAIATNPPWGAYKNLRDKSNFSVEVKSGETFSMFLEKSIQLLREGGSLSFLLPESILKIKTHADIRKIILKHTKISRINLLGRKFTGVFTPVVLLDLIKEKPQKNWPVTIEQNGRKFSVAQERFNRNDRHTFDVSIEAKDEDLLKRIFSIKHQTLSKNAEWALGVVTGDNKKHLTDVRTKDSEGIFRGSDIFCYKIGQPKAFINFEPSLYQQVAQEGIYRSPEKLVYRFISRNLTFAYDDKQRLTLNSANILIPYIPGMRIKVALAFLNSKVFQYIFIKRFSTHKVLRGDLEKFPFPVIGNKLQETIEGHVESIIAGVNEQAELENLIFKAFGLSNEDILKIKRTLEA